MPSKKFEAFLSERGVYPTCEVCGKNTWSMPEDNQTVIVEIPSAQINSGNALYPAVRSTIPAYVMACLNCGNIRLHAQVVAGDAMKRPS
jgi:hypothetical protein